MGHSHDSKKDKDKDFKGFKNTESSEDFNDISNNPFFEKNDLTLLSVINPLLSPKAQRLLSFFINYGNDLPETPSPNPLGNISDLLQQMSSGQRNSLMEIAPSLLSMLAASQDSKNGNGGGLNPALLSTLLTTMMNNKKED
ncbi:MAG TPA: hypothetical protein PLC07_05350 [Bacillota bacterium]|nr:hypothetical protein [Bacillota bacterium]HPT86314.1 hypothetical protein [Bacillota bacterium]